MEFAIYCFQVRCPSFPPRQALIRCLQLVSYCFDADCDCVETYRTLFAINIGTEVPTPYLTFKPRKAKHWVWKYVSKYNKVYADKVHLVKCDRCPMDINYGSNQATSHLVNHVFSHHRDLFDLNSDSASPITSTLDSIVRVAPSFEECYLRWIVSRYLPFDTCDSPEFRAMCRALSRSAPILERHSIAQRLAVKVADVREKLITHLSGQHCALTCDHWSSCAMQSYFAATVHFIDQDWNFLSATLACTHHAGRQTGAETRRILEATMEGYAVQPEQVMAVVTDTAANMNSAGILFAYPHHYCAAHVVELTTGRAFSDLNLPGGDEAMRAARHLVGFFSHSALATDRLLAHQDEGRKVKLIQDVVTRWWSTLSMCVRLVRLQGPLQAMEDAGELASTLSDRQWSVIHQLVAILTPFQRMQRMLEGEKYVTISLLPYHVHKMRVDLVEVIATDIDPTITALATEMLTDFNTRWGTGVEGTVFSLNLHRVANNRQQGLPRATLLAAALDPRTKSLVGIPDNDQGLLWEEVKAKMLERMQQQALLQPPAPAAADVDDVEDVGPDEYADLIQLPEAVLVFTANQRAENELGAYRTAHNLPMFVAGGGVFSNPLDWWRQNAHLFPTVAYLARKYLCIPATSAPSERVFSHAGLTIANARANLLPENAAGAVFLHDAWHVVDELEERARKRRRNKQLNKNLVSLRICSEMKY